MLLQHFMARILGNDEDAQTTRILEVIAEQKPVRYESGKKTCRYSLDGKSKTSFYYILCSMELLICVAQASPTITFTLKKKNFYHDYTFVRKITSLS